MAKKSIIALLTITGIFLYAPTTKAQTMTDILPEIMTPEELQIYQKKGKDEAMTVARQACSYLDAGNSLEEVAQKMAVKISSEKVSQQQLELLAGYVSKVIAAGIFTLCPDHLSKLEALQKPR
jgi:hypothetical protein